jgi:hypothetical protein
MFPVQVQRSFCSVINFVEPGYGEKVQNPCYNTVFQKELYNGIPNVTVYLKAYKLYTIQHLERWKVCTPLNVNVFVTFATQ